MAKKVNKPLLRKTDEAGTGRFLMIYFLFFITHMRPLFFKVKKDRDERHFKQMREGLGNN